MGTISMRTLADMAYGKPVGDTVAPTAETIAGARDLHTDGYGQAPAVWGVIVHRRVDTVDGDQAEVYDITWCDSARYRDNVLLPFYGFYDGVERIERFGPDITPEVGA